jgi:hypothetical protein
MEIKRCAACNQSFRQHPQVRNQSYCSAPECQRERRRRSQQKKRRDDPDYRDNDSRNNKDWAAKSPDYWKRYREDHPDYADRNRRLQQIRNQKQREAKIAKVDESGLLSSLPSGRYRLTPITTEGIASEDSWIVEISVLSATCDDSDT